MLQDKISTSRIEAKIQFAKDALTRLEKEIEQFSYATALDNKQRIEVGSPGEEVQIKVPQELAHEISIHVGVFIYLIRAPLDYLVTLLAVKNSGLGEGAAFPFGKDEAALNAAIKRSAKNLSSDAQEFLRAQRPTKDGDHILWSLNELSNIDKHRDFISGLAPVTIHTEQITDHPYKWEIIPNPDAKLPGSTALPWKLQDFHEYNIEISCDVVFDSPEPIRGASVMGTLNEMLRKVEAIIAAAESLLVAEDSQ